MAVSAFSQLGEGVVLSGQVKVGAQGAVPFLLADGVAKAGDGRGRGKADGLPSEFFPVQSIRSFADTVFLVCLSLAKIFQMGKPVGLCWGSVVE